MTAVPKYSPLKVDHLPRHRALQCFAAHFRHECSVLTLLDLSCNNSHLLHVVFQYFTVQDNSKIALSCRTTPFQQGFRALKREHVIGTVKNGGQTVKTNVLLQPSITTYKVSSRSSNVYILSLVQISAILCRTHHNENLAYSITM